MTYSGCYVFIVTYSGTKFEAATSNSKGGDAFTKKKCDRVKIGLIVLHLNFTKTWSYYVKYGSYNTSTGVLHNNCLNKSISLYTHNAIHMVIEFFYYLLTLTP